MSEIKKAYLYSKSHEWIAVEGDEALVGLSAHAVEELGDLVYLEYKEVGEQLDKDEIFGSIESVKSASDLYMPVSGEILAVNEDLLDDQTPISKAPYENWLVRIKLSKKDELNELLDADAYAEFIAN